MSLAGSVSTTRTNAVAVLPPLAASRENRTHAADARSGIGHRAGHTRIDLHPVQEASSLPSSVTLNSPGGPVSGRGCEGRVGGGRPRSAPRQ